MTREFEKSGTPTTIKTTSIEIFSRSLTQSESEENFLYKNILKDVVAVLLNM